MEKSHNNWNIITYGNLVMCGCAIDVKEPIMSPPCHILVGMCCPWTVPNDMCVYQQAQDSSKRPMAAISHLRVLDGAKQHNQILNGPKRHELARYASNV